ncbi:hypothetical protein BDZ89DRAFT_5528 [Hymenopellis radicata]|nr:hypothetical protein BDZ89DRAFT_5528 [Hymenopellis radicata]
MDAPIANVHLVQRQGLGLGSVLGGVVGGLTTAVGEVGDAVTSVVGGVTSAVGGVTSAILATSTSSDSTTSTSTLSTSSTSSRTSSSSSITSLSSSSSVSSSSSTSSSSILSSSSSISTLSSTSTTSSTTIAPSTTPEVGTVYVTTSNGVKHTVTAVVAAEPSDTSIATPAANNGFLQNKGLSGFVFALCGLVGLAIIIGIVTFTLRRRRNKKLMDEAVNFDPASSVYRDDLEQGALAEKRRSSSSAGSYRGNGSQGSHGAYMQPALPVQAGYYDTGYGQPSNYNYAEHPSYAPRVPNPAYDASRAPQLYAQPNVPSQLAYYDQTGRGPSPSPPPATQVPIVAHPLPDTFGGDYDEKRSIADGQQGAPLKVAN